MPKLGSPCHLLIPSLIKGADEILPRHPCSDWPYCPAQPPAPSCSSPHSPSHLQPFPLIPAQARKTLPELKASAFNQVATEPRGRSRHKTPSPSEMTFPGQGSKGLPSRELQREIKAMLYLPACILGDADPFLPIPATACLRTHTHTSHLVLSRKGY